jgi:hypothetical protein
MTRPRKYNLPTPPPTTVPPSPAEIIELTGNRKEVRGTPVELVSAGPPLEIIEASSVPRLQLVIVLRFSGAVSEPAAVGLATARFIAAVQDVDRRLHLRLDPDQSRAVRKVATLVLLPAVHRVETAAQLERAAKAIPGIAAGLEGAVLDRVQVVPRE